MTTEAVLDGREIVGVLLRRLWILLILGAIGGLLGYGYAQGRANRYAAEQQFIVTGQVANPLVVSLAQSNEDPSRLVATQSALMTSTAVSQAVERRLGRSPSPATTIAGSSNDLITLRTTAASTTTAVSDLRAYVTAYLALLRRQTRVQLDNARKTLLRRIADEDATITLAAHAERVPLIAQRAQLQTTLDQLDAAESLGAVLVQPVGGPHALGTRVSPRPRLDTGIGVAAGLFLGGLIAVATRRRRDWAFIEDADTEWHEGPDWPELGERPLAASRPSDRRR